MQILGIINFVIGIIFTLCYFYQFIFLIIAYVGKRESIPDAEPRKIAVLIAARNESRVIHNLLESLNEQDYPKDKYTVFLVADNCNDNTAELARQHGATVYERFNQIEKGKGYTDDMSDALAGALWSCSQDRFFKKNNEAISEIIQQTGIRNNGSFLGRNPNSMSGFSSSGRGFANIAGQMRTNNNLNGKRDLGFRYGS